MRTFGFILIVLMTINTHAQDFKAKKLKNHTPDQIATLQTKKMTLHLELNEKQQKEIYSINKKSAELRQENKKVDKKEFTNDERFELKNKVLDNQITTQRQLKNILSEEQFEKWKSNHPKKKRKIKKHRKLKKRKKSMRKKRVERKNHR